MRTDCRSRVACSLRNGAREGGVLHQRSAGGCNRVHHALHRHDAGVGGSRRVWSRVWVIFLPSGPCLNPGCRLRCGFVVAAALPKFSKLDAMPGIEMPERASAATSSRLALRHAVTHCRHTARPCAVTPASRGVDLHLLGVAAVGLMRREHVVIGSVAMESILPLEYSSGILQTLGFFAKFDLVI
jgi:hypothetical protein